MEEREKVWTDGYYSIIRRRSEFCETVFSVVRYGSPFFEATFRTLTEAKAYTEVER